MLPWKKLDISALITLPQSAAVRVDGATIRQSVGIDKFLSSIYSGLCNLDQSAD